MVSAPEKHPAPLPKFYWIAYRGLFALVPVPPLAYFVVVGSWLLLAYLVAVGLFGCHPRRGSASTLAVACFCWCSFCRHPERSEGPQYRSSTHTASSKSPITTRLLNSKKMA
jgi:hypothetical protein